MLWKLTEVSHFPAQSVHNGVGGDGIRMRVCVRACVCVCWCWCQGGPGGWKGQLLGEKCHLVLALCYKGQDTESVWDGRQPRRE